MDEKDKNKLIQNREYIAKTLADLGKAQDVVFELRECQVLPPEVAASLLGMETTQTNMVRHLISYLINGKEKTLQVFLKVLLQLNLPEMVKKIDLDYYEHHEKPMSDEYDKLHHVPHVPHIALGGAEALPFLRRPKQGHPRSRPGSLGYDSGEENNNPEEPLVIRVTESTEVGGMHLDESELYKNLSTPRGLVFLANFKDFREEEHPSRRGSEKDVKNLTLLFTQMGYKIPKQHINMTKYETIKALRDFKSNEELKSVDSCIVIVMSHGRDEKSFYTSDNQYLSVNDVVERFSNRECPALNGKPKIFIFQYCRGSGPDVGVVASPQPVAYVRNQGLETDAAYVSEAIIERDPTYTDMYIVYSTVEGFVSFRHPERGSWLMEAICQVFMKHAHHLELEALMKMVSRRVRQNYADDGSKQVCEFVQRAFDRHFYFNPRHPENIGTLCMQSLSELVDSMGASSLKTCSNKQPLFLSRGTTPEPVRHRQRNWSGASNGSDRSVDELDPHLWSQEGVLLHPRIRRLSGNRRRSLPPDPVALIHPVNPLLNREAWNRSFSEQAQGSRGTTPDPMETPDIFLEDEAAATDECSPTFDTVDCPREIPSPNGNLNEAKSCENIAEKVPADKMDGKIEDVESESRNSIKRQLSFPSTNETLSKINDVKKFLQVYDSDPALIQPLQRIESFVNKKKYEGKRRKLGQESSSLDY